MGGAAGGADAAEVALQAFIVAVCGPTGPGSESDSQRPDQHLSFSETLPIVDRLGLAMSAADAAVREMAARTDRLGAACTLTALVLFGGQLHVAHVGDSRLYLLRGGELAQMSEDHTVLSELDRSIAADSDMGRRLAGVLSRSVGGKSPEAEPYLMTFAAEFGDRVVLTSDGVHGVLPPEEIAGSVAGPLDGAADRLIDVAMAAGGTDDATVLIGQIGSQQGCDSATGELM